MEFREPSSLEVALTKLLMTFIEGSFYRSYVEEMGLKGDEAVLEFGPGAGKMSKYLARSLPRGRLTCVDRSKVWSEVVRKSIGGYPNVDILQGRFTELSLADGAFDVVVVSFVLHDVDEDERQPVVDWLASKLKKGGRMFVRDPEVKNGGWHGISEADLRKTMRGLRELSFRKWKPFYRGPIFQAVYIK